MRGLPLAIEPQREKTYLLTYAPFEDTNQPARPSSLTSLRCSREVTLNHWLSKIHLMKILTRLLIWIFAARTCPKVLSSDSTSQFVYCINAAVTNKSISFEARKCILFWRASNDKYTRFSKQTNIIAYLNYRSYLMSWKNWITTWGKCY